MAAETFRPELLCQRRGRPGRASAARRPLDRRAAGRSGDAHPAGVAHPQPGDPWVRPGTGGAPSAAWLSVERAGPLLGEVREVAFLGFHESIAHFAIEVSHLEDPAPVASLAEAATFADLRTVGPLLEPRPGRPPRLCAGHDALARAAPVLRGVRAPDREPGGRPCAPLHEQRLRRLAFPAHRPGRHHARA